MRKRNVWTRIKFANYEIIYYIFNNDISNSYSSIFFSITLFLQLFSIPLSTLVNIIIILFSFSQFGVIVKQVKE